MRNSLLVLIVLLLAMATMAVAQPESIKNTFPEGTVFNQNIPYANDTLKKHRLDIYLPPNMKPNSPLIIWVHGGGWDHGDKYADMGYMKNTIKSIINSGYALASIDYRQSYDAVFPGQIRDCYQALEFLHQNAAKYKVDRARFVLFGFSAGGQLASLLGLSLNNNVTEFFPAGKPSFKIKAVIDFYGPSELLMFYNSLTPLSGKDDDSIARMLGASPLARPDLAKKASPATYVDKDDPPFFIVNGEKDDAVLPAQSYLLKSWFDIVGVKSQLTIVPGAPHYGVMFDTDEMKDKLLGFLKGVL